MLPTFRVKYVLYRLRIVYWLNSSLYSYLWSLVVKIVGLVHLMVHWHQYWICENLPASYKRWGKPGDFGIFRFRFWIFTICYSGWNTGDPSVTSSPMAYELHCCMMLVWLQWMSAVPKCVLLRNKMFVSHVTDLLTLKEKKVILYYTNDKRTDDQQAVTQDSITSTGTQAGYNNWV